jgi:hypothetical protein
MQVVIFCCTRKDQTNHKLLDVDFVHWFCLGYLGPSLSFVAHFELISRLYGNITNRVCMEKYPSPVYKVMSYKVKF